MSWFVSAEINDVHTLAPRRQRREMTLTTKDGKPMTVYSVSHADCFGLRIEAHLDVRPSLARNSALHDPRRTSLVVGLCRPAVRFAHGACRRGGCSDRVASAIHA